MLKNFDHITYRNFGIEPTTFYAGKFARDPGTTDFLADPKKRFSIEFGRARFLARNVCGPRVLDLGCGSAPYAQTLRTNTNVHELFGMDLDPAGIAAATQVYDHAAVHDICEALPFPSGYFDTVFSCDLFGHIEFRFKDRVISEIRRVTKPAGRSVHIIESGQLDYDQITSDPDDPLRKYVLMEGHIGIESAPSLLVRWSRVFLSVSLENAMIYPLKTIASYIDDAETPADLKRVMQAFDLRERDAAQIALGYASDKLIEQLREEDPLLLIPAETHPLRRSSGLVNLIAVGTASPDHPVTVSNAGITSRHDEGFQVSSGGADDRELARALRKARRDVLSLNVRHWRDQDTIQRLENQLQGTALRLPRERAEIDDLGSELKDQIESLERAISGCEQAVGQAADMGSLSDEKRERLRARVNTLSVAVDKLTYHQANGGNHAPVEIDPVTALPSSGVVAASPPKTLIDRYGVFFADAGQKLEKAFDVVWLGVIGWHFRIQRPQHLAQQLARTGARVFYVSPTFEASDGDSRFRIVDAPQLGVFEVRLNIAGGHDESLYRGFSATAVANLHLALDELMAVSSLHSPVVVVDHPFWHQVAYGIPGATIVYDCLDLATGFADATAGLAVAERDLIANSDLVVAASQPLAEHITGRRVSTLIRNAADVAFFADGFSDRIPTEHPIIGYFGAIADWFNMDWIEVCAAARPDWEFRLIGETFGCDITRAAELPNVRFLGERPYQELPQHLKQFDVTLIPFKLTELTKHTNPVKLYEYMAAGKPVVASRMPEVVEATGLVYVADDAVSFTERIAQALREDCAEARTGRREWACQHDWTIRARDLMEAIDTSYAPVSVIVSCHNEWQFTEACLYSLRRWSDYPDLEYIVVDNGSTDDTPMRLRDLAARDNTVRVIPNNANRTVAGGYNAGLRAARGQYVILLGNDTYVTRGWVRDLIRPMQLDPRVGVVGPLTNNIAGEQEVGIAYKDMREMAAAAQQLVRSRSRRILEVNALSFFCAAFRKALVTEIGEVDEAYNFGFFADHDFCFRARQAGYKLVIAEDVFVHRHGLARGDTPQAETLMAQAREIFERRWGPWPPFNRKPAADPG